VRCQHRGPESKGVIIVGVGSTLRGDDAVGQVVTRALEPYIARTHVYLVTVHQLLPELALTLRHARLAIVVDAAVDVTPGRVIEQRVFSSADVRALGHCDAIQEVLHITRRLYHHVPETWVVSIGGGRWDVGAPLSPAVNAAVPRALHRIEFIIAARCPACVLHQSRQRRRAVARS
jgi:hydrogenase maturation protease